MKVYERYEDVHVACTIVYANDGKVYFDEEFTQPISIDELKNLFFKGVAIEYAGTFYKPAAFAGDEITTCDGTSFSASKVAE